MPEPLSAAEFRALAAVSRETMDRLEAYAALLRRWQKAVNLVSNASLDDFWRRHFLDSAQLARYLPPEPGAILDLGSGAGFPGLVLAIVTGREIHLAESDKRKAAFLAEAIRTTAAPAFLHADRIENLRLPPVATVTARALAPLDELLAYAAPRLKPEGTCLFLKGRRVEEELTQAREHWIMKAERFPSIADPGGTVIRLGGIARAKS